MVQQMNYSILTLCPLCPSTFLLTGICPLSNTFNSLVQMNFNY